MALKSSQPRRNASVRSERPILRTTYPVATPNSCSLGLAKTVVDMSGLLARDRRATHAQVAHIRIKRENRDRARQTSFDGKEPCRTEPVATGTASLARWAQESTHGWVNCAAVQICTLHCI